MSVKKAIKRKSDYNTRKRKQGTTIWSTLVVSVFVVILSIIIVTFTMSLNVVNSAQNNDITSFYKNFKVFNNPMQTSSDFEEILPELRAYMNSILESEYEVKDILVADKNGRIVYTSLNNDKGDDFSYNLGEPIPLRIKQSSSYTVSKHTIITIPRRFPNTEYRIYLVVKKPTSEYRNSIIFQSIIFFIIIVLIAITLISVLVRRITTPLDIMEKTVSQIAKGDLSGRLEYSKYDEINRLVGAYNMMANALQRLYSSLEAQVNDRTRELKGAYAELQSTQAMMVHSEKMKSLGELVAGIMHEINNPINFIYGNMTHLGNYSKSLIEIIDEYTKYDNSLNINEKTQVIKLKKDCDYDFLRTDMPDLIKSCKEGADRAKNIIQDLKSFSRMEEVSIKDVDLPKEIDTVLNILHNKIKNKATVHKEYMENVPKIEAFGGQLNQVFMNIIDNAVGAIEKTGDIWIRINIDDAASNLVIEIEDNGSGMDEETVKKVFDPFFTTKPVGQGTGLGMSITYKIIKNHQGDISVQSKKGFGSKYTIKLPLNIDRESLKANVSKEEKI